MVYRWGRFFAVSSAISFTYRYVANELYKSIGLNEDDKEKTTGDLFIRTALDVMPFYRLNPREVIQPPILPDLPVQVYGQFKPFNKRVGQNVIDYGLDITPIAGVINRTLQRATGETVGELLTKTGTSGRSSRSSR